MSQGNFSNILLVRQNLFDIKQCNHDFLNSLKLQKCLMQAKIFLRVIHLLCANNYKQKSSFPKILSRAVCINRKFFYALFYIFHIKLSNWYFMFIVKCFWKQGIFSITLPTSFDGHDTLFNKYLQNPRFRASTSSLHHVFQVFF